MGRERPETMIVLGPNDVAISQLNGQGKDSGQDIHKLNKQPNVVNRIGPMQESLNESHFVRD